MSTVTDFLMKSASGAVQPKVTLAGFGKYPAMSEHVQDLGNFSVRLVELRTKLYADGIMKMAGVLSKLPPESQGEFDHWLVWILPDAVVIGRILASTDLNRREGTFIVLAELQGCPLSVALRRIAPAVEEFAGRAMKLPSPDVVRSAFSNQRGVLESLIVSELAGVTTLPPTPEERAAFLGGPALDADGVSLSHLLYKIESSWSDYAPVRGKAPKLTGSGVSLRLPSLPGQLGASVLLWEEFVTAQVHREVPRLYIVSAKNDWLDLVIGEVKTSNFDNLVKNRKGLAPETEVAYPATPDLQSKAKATLSAWLAGEALIPVMPIKSGDTKFETIQFRKSETAAPVTAPVAQAAPVASPAPLPTPKPAPLAPASTPRSKGGLIIGAVSAVVLIGGVLLGIYFVGQHKNQTYETALARARSAEAASNWTNALASYQEALQLKKDDSAAAAKITEVTPKAQKQIQAAHLAENQQDAVAAAHRQYLAALSAGKKALADNDFDGALTQANAALKLVPNDADALSLQKNAEDGKSLAMEHTLVQQKYVTAMQSGKDALARNDYEKALAFAKQALAILPGDVEATTLQSNAQNAKVAAESTVAVQQKHAQAMRDGKAAYERGAYDMAIAQAKLALSLVSSDAAATTLLNDAENQKKLLADQAEVQRRFNQAIQKANDALSRQDYETAISRAREASKLMPGNADAAALLAKADEGKKMDAELAQARKQYETAMAAANRAFQNKDYDGAIQQAKEALKSIPRDATATALIANAEAANKEAAVLATKRSEYNAALDAAKKAYDAKNYDTAIARANACLNLFPNDPDAGAVLSKAEIARAKDPDYQHRKEVASLDQALAVLMQQFDLESRIKCPAVKSASRPGVEPIKGLIDLGVYKNEVEKLRKGYDSLGVLDKERNADLSTLLNKILSWNGFG